MNKFLLGLNIVLLIAVSYLYYEHYHYIDADVHGKEQDNAAVINSLKIAYFELDSLQTKYEYYKEVKDYLTKKDAQYNQELSAIRTKYQVKLKEYQDRGPSLSQSQQSEYEQALMNLQRHYSATEKKKKIKKHKKK